MAFLLISSYSLKKKKISLHIIIKLLLKIFNPAQKWITLDTNFFYKDQKDLEIIANIFYNFTNLKIIFVTGTNGKTSVADLFYQILS